MALHSRNRSKLADVARIAGVGNATVSRALNGGKNVSSEKMERISAAIHELGYRPNRVARSLKGASSGMIGMIVPSISDTFFSRCAEVVEAVAHEHGSLLVVVPSHEQDDTIISGLRQLLLHNIDGLLLAHNMPHSRELAAELRGLRLPVVGIDGPLDDLGLPSVVCQNVRGASMATEHLLGHGYRKIIHVQVKPSLYTMCERLRGYIAAMEAARAKPATETISNREDAIAVLKRHTRASPGVQPGLAPKPVAIFAGNNLTARYLCEAIRILGLAVPEQVALLSFDDFDLADTLSPPTSVIQQPIEAMGRTAARILFERMAAAAHGPAAHPTPAIMLAPRLILRQSCGCHPQRLATADRTLADSTPQLAPDAAAC